MIRGVLFDLGDTLVTSQDKSEILSTILKEKDIHRTLEEIAAAIESAESTFGSRCPKTILNAVEMDRFYEELNSQVYKELGLKNHDALGIYAHQRWFELAGIRLYDDVTTVINRLSAMGMKLGIVTNGYYEEARDIMNRAWQRESVKGLAKSVSNPESLFSVIVGRDTAGAEKPDPRPFLHAAGTLGLRPDEIMFVGDRYDKDYVGSQGAGMVPVLILRGRKLPAGVPHDTTRIQTLDELLGLIR